MLFKGKSTVHLYLDEKKLYWDSIQYTILNISVNNSEYARFSFKDHEAKLFRGILTITDIVLGIVHTLSIVRDEEEASPVEAWDRYRIHGDNYVSLSSDKKKIRLDNTEFDVLSSYVSGIHTIYTTNKGNLALSSDDLVRHSMWNYINISRA